MINANLLLFIIPKTKNNNLIMTERFLNIWQQEHLSIIGPITGEAQTY